MKKEELLRNLERPRGRIDVVLDTDTYNEIDDQFALAYMLRSEEKLNIMAVYAAPFLNTRSLSPEDGMEKSYCEILNILTLAEREDLKPSVYRGSRMYLPDESSPVISDAAANLVSRALGYSSERPLFVAAIGAITNIASALLMDPRIRDRIVVVWLGGHAWDQNNTKEFNMMQDVAAARVVFGCGVPLVQLPCNGVVSALTTTGPELRHWLSGKNRLCDYLVDATIREGESYAAGKVWSRVIWDAAVIGWLLDEDSSIMQDRKESSPIPQYDHHYSIDRSRHPIKYVYRIDRDRLFGNMFEKLSRQG